MSTDDEEGRSEASQQAEDLRAAAPEYEEGYAAVRDLFAPTIAATAAADETTVAQPAEEQPVSEQPVATTPTVDDVIALLRSEG